jgi:hypothetical protein
LVLDYMAYLMAQRRVVDVARGALPEDPAHLPEVASDPLRRRATARLRTATSALRDRLANHPTGFRVLAPPSPPTIAAVAPVGTSAGCSPVLIPEAKPRPTAAKAGRHEQHHIASRSVA